MPDGEQGTEARPVQPGPAEVSSEITPRDRSTSTLHKAKQQVNLRHLKQSWAPGGGGWPGGVRPALLTRMRTLLAQDSVRGKNVRPHVATGWRKLRHWETRGDRLPERKVAHLFSKGNQGTQRAPNRLDAPKPGAAPGESEPGTHLLWVSAATCSSHPSPRRPWALHSLYPSPPLLLTPPAAPTQPLLTLRHLLPTVLSPAAPRVKLPRGRDCVSVLFTAAPQTPSSAWHIVGAR